jgi:predicted GIY-YIG superfamily endonuclease
MAFFVYILKCSDGSYYTGHTEDADVRLAAHQLSLVDSYVSKRLPVELMFVESAPTREEALSFEQQIKRWSRAKKEALIAKDWGKLKQLSRSYESRAVHGSRSSPRTEVSDALAFSPEHDEGSPRMEVSDALAFNPEHDEGSPRTEVVR